MTCLQTIRRVTNLNAEGHGSFLDAINAPDVYKMIVFDVSGTIWLTQDLFVRVPYVVIAGETAPSPGITIAGAGIRVETHDVEIRHICDRVGDRPNGPGPAGRGGIIVGNYLAENVYNVLVDHCSVSWAVDENITLWYPGVRNVTVRHCIISEGLYDSIHPSGPHSKGLLIGDHAQHVLVYGNLFAHNFDRNPVFTGDTTCAIVNNLIYNTPGYGIHTHDANESGPVTGSIIGNVILSGLDDTPGRLADEILIFMNTREGSRIYLDDNLAYLKNNAAFDVIVDEPIWLPKNLAILSSDEVQEWVLYNAGARPWDRDAIDQRMIDDVLNGTGHIIDSQDDVGGWV